MSGERILVVDDERQNRQLLESILEFGGYAPISVADGNEARLETISSYEKGQGIPLIISDVQMPVLDGPSFYQKVIEFYTFKGTGAPLIIFMSGGMTDEQKTIVDGLNPFELIQKPYDPEKLLDIIRRALESSN